MWKFSLGVHDRVIYPRRLIKVFKHTAEPWFPDRVKVKYYDMEMMVLGSVHG